MMSQRVRALAVSMLVPAAIVAGCAKDTVTTDVFAPPPAATPAPLSPSGAPTAERPVAPLGEIVTRPGTAEPGTPAPPGALAPSTPLPSTRPVPAEFAARAELADIYFDFDRYDIRPGDARILDASAAWLRANPGTLVLIEGHCDERGTDAYNLALGDRRAKAAMDYLVSRGIQAERITTLTYGKERPVCREHTEACWVKNRRADFGVKAR
jgi:peptidoglycan-associated lipoprotein